MEDPTIDARLGGPSQAAAALFDADLLKAILQRLPELRDVCAASCVCKVWCQVAASEDFWRELSFEHRPVQPQQLIALLAKHRGVHALNLTGLIGGLSRDVVLRVLPSLQQLRSLRYCSPQLLAPSGCTAAVAAAAAAAAAGSPATTTPSSPGIAGCITARTLSTLCSGLPALLSLELRGLFVQDAESPGGAILCHSSLTSLVLARCEAPALTLKCDTLRTLSLEGSSLPGLPCLVGCTALTELRLPGCRRLHDPNLRAALPALTGLHALTLGGGMLLGDDTLREVANTLTLLTRLELCDSSGLTLLGAVPFPALKVLDLRRCEGVTAAALPPVVQGSPVLEVLLLDGCHGLTALRLTAPQLQELSLCSCPLLAEVNVTAWRLRELRIASNGALRSLRLRSDELRCMEWVQCKLLRQVELNCPQLLDLLIRDCDSLAPEVIESLGDKGPAPQLPRGANMLHNGRGCCPDCGACSCCCLCGGAAAAAGSDGGGGGGGRGGGDRGAQTAVDEAAGPSTLASPLSPMALDATAPNGGDIIHGVGNGNHHAAAAAAAATATASGTATCSGSAGDGWADRFMAAALGAATGAGTGAGTGTGTGTGTGGSSSRGGALRQAAGCMSSSRYCGRSSSSAAHQLTRCGPDASHRGADAAPPSAVVAHRRRARDSDAAEQHSNFRRAPGLPARSSCHAPGGSGDGSAAHAAAPMGDGGAGCSHHQVADGVKGVAATTTGGSSSCGGGDGGGGGAPQPLPSSSEDEEGGDGGGGGIGGGQGCLVHRWQHQLSGSSASSSLSPAERLQERRALRRLLLQRCHHHRHQPQQQPQQQAGGPTRAVFPSLRQDQSRCSPCDRQRTAVGIFPRWQSDAEPGVQPWRPFSGPADGSQPGGHGAGLAAPASAAPQAAAAAVAAEAPPAASWRPGAAIGSNRLRGTQTPGGGPGDGGGGGPGGSGGSGSGGVPKLRTLRIESCEHLNRLHLSHARLSRLLLSGCPSMKLLVLRAPALTRLDLLDASDVRVLSLQQVGLPLLSLGACNELRSLDVSGPSLSQLDVRGCAQLEHLQLECPRLQQLDATFCASLSDAGLTNAVAHVPPLRALVLSVCTRIGARGLGALSALHTLVELDLSYTDVQGLECVYASCPALTSLSVASCRSLPPTALAPLLSPGVRALPGLRALDASYCELAPGLPAALAASAGAPLTRLALNGCSSVGCEFWQALEGNSNSAGAPQVLHGARYCSWDEEGRDRTAAAALSDLSLVRCAALRSLCLGLLPVSGTLELLPQRRAGSVLRTTIPPPPPPAWVPVPSALAGLTSLRAGLSGVQVLALALPRLARLDVSGAPALRVLELRCPLLLALQVQACRSLPAGCALAAAGGCRSLRQLDMQHVGGTCGPHELDGSSDSARSDLVVLACSQGCELCARAGLGC